MGLLLVALIQVLCLFALVDQYRSLLQIRDALRLVDVPSDLRVFDLDGVAPSSVGLPNALDTEPFALVLLLSTRCATCKAVARGMSGQVPNHTWPVIEGRSFDECQEFREEVGLVGQQVSIDVGGKISDRLKTRIFPAAIVFLERYREERQNNSFVSAAPTAA